MMLRGGGCCWSQNWGDRDMEDAQDVLVTEPEQPADPDPQAQFFFFFFFLLFLCCLFVFCWCHSLRLSSPLTLIPRPKF